MSNENKKTVHIDIVSDVICPWYVLTQSQFKKFEQVN
jgi:predicted DsbA family dithiol-disulfide isomerase